MDYTLHVLLLNKVSKSMFDLKPVYRSSNSEKYDLSGRGIFDIAITPIKHIQHLFDPILMSD